MNYLAPLLSEAGNLLMKMAKVVIGFRFKLLVIWLLVIFSPIFSFAQSHVKYSNGLIYNQPTMDALKHIVDSMNLIYKPQTAEKKYYARSQAICNSVVLDSVGNRAVLNDMKAGMAFDSFCRKYPDGRIRRDQLCLNDALDLGGKKMHAVFTTVPLGPQQGVHVTLRNTKLLHKQLKHKWVFQFRKRTKFSPASVKALYFTTDFSNPKLPDEYARLIQYADFMMDTNSTVFLPDAKGESYSKVCAPMRVKFQFFLDTYAGDRPHFFWLGSDSGIACIDAYNQEITRRNQRIATVFEDGAERSKEAKLLLQAAIAEAIRSGISDVELESLAYQFDTKEHALSLHRMRVPGMWCGSNPEFLHQVTDISLISAECRNWSVFLRAHLNILGNERFFERDTANASIRTTLVLELEKMDIDVATLLTGLMFQQKEPTYHEIYNIRFAVPNAFVEMPNPDRIEKIMYNAIKDDELDIFNRFIMFSLYKDYLRKLPDSDRKKSNIVKLREALSSIPEVYRANYQLDETDFN